MTRFKNFSSFNEDYDPASERSRLEPIADEIHKKLPSSYNDEHGQLYTRLRAIPVLYKSAEGEQQEIIVVRAEVSWRSTQTMTITFVRIFDEYSWEFVGGSKGFQSFLIKLFDLVRDQEKPDSSEFWIDQKKSHEHRGNIHGKKFGI